jgi:hypothetical protein
MAEEQPPHLAFVGREAAIAAVRPTMDVAGPLMRECVDMGGRVFLGAMGVAGGLPPDVAIAPFRLYHKVLEATDAAEPLLSAGNVRAAADPVRNSFQAAAELMFMANLAGRFEEASLAWYVSKLKRERSQVNSIKALYPVGDTIHGELDQRLDQISHVLAQPHIASVAAVHASDPWYRRFGPAGQLKSLEDLTPLLDGAGETTFRNAYRLLFARFSEMAHASDYNAFYDIVDGRPSLRPVRQPDEIAAMAGTAVGMFLGATYVIARRLKPDLVPELQEWYATKVQARYLEVVHGKK